MENKQYQAWQSYPWIADSQKTPLLSHPIIPQAMKMFIALKQDPI